MTGRAGDIHLRLRQLRRRAGLSLRAFAATLKEEASYSVSHDSVRLYEEDRSVPAGYVSAVCEAFGVQPAWLLMGEGEPATSPASSASDVRSRNREIARSGEAYQAAVESQWRRFVSGLATTHPLRATLLESWERSAEAGVDADPDEPRFVVVPADERIRRTERAASLVSAARPHLDWLSTILSSVAHVAYLVCEDGIVIECVTNERSLIEEWGIFPGVDWSESTMGTNGAGTALATGRPTVIFGCEHFVRPFHESVCAGAPIHGPDGTVMGALDLSTTVANGEPRTLAIVPYVASMIERDLRSP